MASRKWCCQFPDGGNQKDFENRKERFEAQQSAACQRKKGESSTSVVQQSEKSETAVPLSKQILEAPISENPPIENSILVEGKFGKMAWASVSSCRSVSASIQNSPQLGSKNKKEIELQSIERDLKLVKQDPKNAKFLRNSPPKTDANYPEDQGKVLQNSDSSCQEWDRTPDRDSSSQQSEFSLPSGGSLREKDLPAAYSQAENQERSASDQVILEGSQRPGVKDSFRSPR